MLVLKKEAEKRMTSESSDDASKGLSGIVHLTGSIVEDALYYGLDALQQKKVNLRNVD